MNKRIQIIFILLFCSQINQTEAFYSKHNTDYKPIVNKFDNSNLLQEIQSTPAPIRITYDDTEIQNLENSNLKKLLLKAVKGAEKFYEDLLIVQKPHTSDITVQNTQEGIPCNNKVFLNYPKQRNSDFHFYIKLIEIDQKVIATSICCQLNNALDNRPEVAVINFNTKHISSFYNDYYSFQKVLKITIHELFHAFVFSPTLYPQFKDSKNKYGDYYFSFPNILKWAQDHYGCEDITQFPIESNGDQGSKGAHWSRDLLNNDINTASQILGNMLWSGANNALLLDSGWYNVDNIEKKSEPIKWGYKKGCSFFNKDTCNLKFDEYCQSSSKQNSFTYSGLGLCSSTKQGIDDFAKCPYVSLYNNMECQNPKNNLIDINSLFFDEFNVVYGSKSAAFQSNLMPSSGYMELPQENLFCYQHKCNKEATKIEIYFDEYTLNCEQDGQVISLPLTSDYSGRLVCPNIQDFCSKQLQCEDFCSSNGYCMNGKCHCINETYGEKCECSKNENLNQPSCNLKQIKNCNIYNEDGSCMKCLSAFDLEENSCLKKTFASKIYFKLLLIITIFYLFI